MKIRKIILGLGIAFVFLFFSACNISFENKSTQYKTPITNTTPLTTHKALDKITYLKKMAKDYQEACVSIIVADSQGEPIKSGSGVAIHAGGYIATNWHVVSDFESTPEINYSLKVQVYQPNKDENECFFEYNAKVLWLNETFDLAVLRCEFTDIHFVKMCDRWIDSDNRLEIAEEIWTMGSPYSTSLQGTYSKGTISSELERESFSGGRVYESLIQHDAPIGNGSSGGGLFDENGYLVGLNTLGINSTNTTSANGLFFAVPIYPIINIIDDIVMLEEDGISTTNYSFPKIGVMGYDEIIADYNTKYEFKGKGVYSMMIVKGSSCFGKLQAGDVIVGISALNADENSQDGYYKINKRNDLLHSLSNFKSGDMIKIYFTHGSGTSVETAEITLD